MQVCKRIFKFATIRKTQTEKSIFDLTTIWKKKTDKRKFELATIWKKKTDKRNKFFPFQKMHTLLKHKMLQFLDYTAPTCFGPHVPSSGST
jgi:hypothetical protein